MQKIMFDEKYGLMSAVEAKIKTMTRREPFFFEGEIVSRINESGNLVVFEDHPLNGVGKLLKKSRFKKNEIIAVAESYSKLYEEQCEVYGKDSDNCVSWYNMFSNTKGWNNKMYVKANYMPLRIKIKDIFCERLQDINNRDALREGVIKREEEKYWVPEFTFSLKKGKYWGLEKSKYLAKEPKVAFAALINYISGENIWDKNPYIIVYEFELI